MTNIYNSMMKVEIRESNDGSSTLYNVDLDETYHSVHGAIQEAEHVFIEMGLKQVLKNKIDISILEIGFGTGLNALLSINQIIRKEIVKVNYTGVEKYPIEESNWRAVNYPEILGGGDYFEKMHLLPWEVLSPVQSNFHLKKTKLDILTFRDSDKYDIIYFDAFSPTSQPELWCKDVFQNMFDSLKNNGVFVTYCAKGQVRRDLQSVGFKMERLPGPPGKREMLRGTKG
jgi:tRNA U34 5-methylaminomethyl-2-thiouridine-forming methyltransferase MnmC